MPRSQGTSRKGKPKKADRSAGMGRALQRAQKAKFRPKSNGSSRGAGMAASGAGDVGTEPIDPHANIRSVLETDDLTDFLARAELADQEFASEHEKFVVVDTNARQVSNYNDGSNGMDGKEKDFDFEELSVPRRPEWDASTTPQQLQQMENESFLEWRRKIAILEEKLSSLSGGAYSMTRKDTTITPFEKNLEVWRQLWRVLERSDIIVLVVDGRNPLFYVSMDLRKYVEEELNKSMIVVINKCDYLTQSQRQVWHEHFVGLELDHVFFSAVEEQQVLDDKVLLPEELQQELNNKEEEKDETFDTTYDKPTNKSTTLLDPHKIGIQQTLTRSQLLQTLCDFRNLTQQKDSKDIDDNTDGTQNEEKKLEFGMVGYPNVGKSSVLNVLVGASKRDHGTSRVAVASQPGKTKHFQTLFVPDRKDIVLCDCPGLVFPTFVSSGADLVLAGVYPLAQVRDFVPSMDIICQRIPKEILEAYYSVKCNGGQDNTMEDVISGRVDPSFVLPDDFLKTYCIARSLIAAGSGVPDRHLAARVIIKDYVLGKLLYCHAPPPPGSNTNMIQSIDESSEFIDPTEWQDSFQKETLINTLKRTSKLQVKLKNQIQMNDAQQQNEMQDDEEDPSMKLHEKDYILEEGTTSISPDLEEEIDMDILDMIGGMDGVSGGGSGKAAKGNEKGPKRGKKHQRIKQWGKKGRKMRNKDPYGCHTDADSELLEGVASSAGLYVNSGKKNGNQNYTRMDKTNYTGVRSANEFVDARLR